jgi:hypothetical protein
VGWLCTSQQLKEDANTRAIIQQMLQWGVKELAGGHGHEAEPLTKEGYAEK